MIIATLSTLQYALIQSSLQHIVAAILLQMLFNASKSVMFMCRG